MTAPVPIATRAAAPPADLRWRVELALLRLERGLDRRTVLFTPHGRWVGGALQVHGCVQGERFGEGVVAALESEFHDLAIEGRLEFPVAPHFVRVAPAGTALHASPRLDSEQVTAVTGPAADPEAGAVAVVLRDQGLDLNPPPVLEEGAPDDDGHGFLVVQLPDGYIGNVDARRCESLTPDEYRDIVARNRDSAREGRLLRAAESFLGTRYLWGGTTRDRGIDCSGFVQRVVEAATGLLLPRDVNQQARLGGPAGLLRHDDDLFPGDLLFFVNPLGRIYHVALSAGGAEYLHSGGETGVGRASLDPEHRDYLARYAANFCFARRLWR